MTDQANLLEPYPLTADWPDNGKSFSEAAPDPDALQEQRQHDAARTASRHPDQPYYPGPVALPPKESEPKNVYEMAKTLVEKHAQWGETRQVGKTDIGKVYITPYNGRLLLTHRISITYPETTVECGLLSPESGWLWTVTPEVYEQWKRAAQSGKRMPQVAQGGFLLPGKPEHGKQWG